ncbi:hypothetical protein DLAC_01813 [Tieghemostelium lacteum]|uniref:SH3 domain-containing protein n=1 Tax=Tieghemostelium lacteum TaxID=361077 RepID=A0A152A6E0_TIELA|nr:hypothetical protein DLAC_01813 [Tieghemostelium lacteum]|eukprot:KYR01799.1 hypothetical protein DLAC_01813 [Tieghemostelium lacteum]
MITSNSFFEVIAIKEHKPVHQSQLAFKKGAKFIVVEMLLTGWWRGEHQGKSGLFPQSYVQRVEPEETNNESPELSGIDQNKPQTDQQYTIPPPLHPLISVTNLNINDIKIEEFINNLPPPPSEDGNDVGVHQLQQQTSQPQIRSLSPPPPLMPISQTTSNTNNNESRPVQLPRSPRFNITNIQQQLQQQQQGRPQSPGVKGNQSPTYQFNTISNTRSSTTSSPTPQQQQSQPQQQEQQQEQPQQQQQQPQQQTQQPQQQKGHSRKNSGPSTSVTSVDEAADESNLRNNADRFKTMPSNSVKTRSPLLNNQRIGMKDINPEVPYYITRAMQSFQKQAFDELDINSGELILVYNHKDIESDWWVGKIKTTFGVFPKKCVEIIKDISPQPTVLSPPLTSQQAANQHKEYLEKQQQQIQANREQQPPTPSLNQSEPAYRKGIAVAHYNSQFANYLSFKKGDEIVLLKKEGEFWKGRIGNQVGLVSPNYVQEVQMPPISKFINNSNSQQPPPIQSQPQTQTNTKVTQPQQQQQQQPQPQPQAKQQPTTTPPSSQSTISEEEAIALKIKESMSQFETREELLNAVQSLAIKFVKQTSQLKKELQDEKSKNSHLQSEISLLESEISILKNIQ